MSTATKKTRPGGKSAVDKSATSSTGRSECLLPVSVMPAGTDPATLPFPEWSDQDVNAEKWDMAKGKDKLASKSPAVSPVTPSAATTAPVESNQFQDHHTVRLPPTILVQSWKRPQEIYSDTTFMIYKEIPEYPDLLTASKHILHCEFMREFISAVGILEYLGDCQLFPMEAPSAQFTPNTEDIPWRPWHHIYSLCKAGKGQKHKPLVNTLGKYVVRLFWMGAWRRVMVDDLIPVDHSNHVLLPCIAPPLPPSTTHQQPPGTPLDDTKTDVPVRTPSTDAKGGKKKKEKSKGSKDSKKKKSAVPVVVKNEVELWPFLLSKAVLKLAALSWTQDCDLRDFNIITCLTGWVACKLDTHGMCSGDIWDMCSGYSDHYAWAEDRIAVQTAQSSTTTKSSKKGDKKSKKTKEGKSKSKSSKSSKKGGKGSKTVSNFLDSEPQVVPFHVVASCTDMRFVEEDVVPDISPCWSHNFLIQQTRDIPLLKPDPKPELARWKRFRWVAWAVRNGLYVDEPILEPIKCFKMVSTFKKFAHHIIYKEPSEESLNIKKSVTVIENVAKEAADGKKGKGKGKDKDKGKGEAKKEKSSASKSKTSSKSSSKKSKDKKDKKPADIPKPPDPSLWGNYNKLAPYIGQLIIYIKPSQFKTQIKVTDVEVPQSLKTTVKKWDKTTSKSGGSLTARGAIDDRLIIWSKDLQDSRNDALYIFLDSIETKYLVVNLNQVGNVESLLKPCSQLDTTKDVTEPYTSLVIEEYVFQTDTIGPMHNFLTTSGSKTLITNLKNGRVILRLWIKSDKSYYMQLLSDSVITIGNMEVILECMAHESELILKRVDVLSSNFGKMVNKFGTPEFLEAKLTLQKGYVPKTFPVNKQQTLLSHKLFLEELMHVIEKIATTDAMYEDLRFAMSVLFMDESIKPKIKPKVVEESVFDYGQYNLDEDPIVNIKLVEKAVITLQSFFRMILVRKKIKMHNRDNSRFAHIFDSLKLIYNLIFSVKNRPVICASLYRKCVARFKDSLLLRDLVVLQNLEELLHVISLKHLTGSLFVPQDSWIQICRFLFFINSPDSQRLRIFLFCDLPKYMVRVFNNDTNAEVKRYTNTTDVDEYECNLEGYTVFCYGWSVNAKLLHWKLSIVMMRLGIENALLIPDSQLAKELVVHNYRPNVYQKICRCLVHIKQNTFLTIRLSTSSSEVRIRLVCLNSQGEKCGEITSTGSAILPVVKMQYIPVENKDEPASMIGRKKNKSASTIALDNSTTFKRRSMGNNNYTTLDDNTSIKDSVRSFRVRKGRSTSNSISTSRSQLPVMMGGVGGGGGGVGGGVGPSSQDTCYVIEGYVVEDSWPLTRDEWQVVDTYKHNNLLHQVARGGSIAGGNSTSSRDNVSTTSKNSRNSVSTSRTHHFPSHPESRRSGQALFDSVTTSALGRQGVVGTSGGGGGGGGGSVGSVNMGGCGGVEKSPCWCLQVVHERADTVMLRRDTRREEEIKKIKRSWYAEDPERYERSVALRKKFLSEVVSQPPEFCTSGNNINTNIWSSITTFDPDLFKTIVEQQKQSSSVTTGSGPGRYTSDSLFTEVTKDYTNMLESRLTTAEPERTFLSPTSYLNKIAPVDLTKFVRPELRDTIDSLEKIVLTPKDIEDIDAQHHEEVCAYEQYLDQFRQDMKRLLADQLENNLVMRTWYQECRNVSKEMMEDAYKLREDFIDMLIAAAAAKPASKDKKDKKDKKKGKKDKGSDKKSKKNKK